MTPSVEDIFHRPFRAPPQEIVMDTEDEQCTYVRTATRHNCYCGVDFSTRPFPTKQQLDLLVHLPVPAGFGMPR